MKLIDMIKTIPKGTFNYKKYKREYNCKFNRNIDITLEYLAQLPYFKIITSPLVFLIMAIEFLPIVVVVLLETLLEKFKEKIK